MRQHNRIRLVRLAMLLDAKGHTTLAQLLDKIAMPRDPAQFTQDKHDMYGLTDQERVRNPKKERKERELQDEDQVENLAKQLGIDYAKAGRLFDMAMAGRISKQEFATILATKEIPSHILERL